MILPLDRVRPEARQVDRRWAARVRRSPRGRCDVTHRRACDARRGPYASASSSRPVPVRCRGRDAAAASSSSTASSGLTGVDRQAGAQLEAGDLAQPRVDLPVPVVGLVDALAQAAPCAGRGCRRARRARRAGAGPSAASPPRSSAARRWRAEVGRVVARHDPQLERRARGVRGEADAGGVLEHEPVARATSSRTSRQNGQLPSRMR